MPVIILFSFFVFIIIFAMVKGKILERKQAEEKRKLRKKWDEEYDGKLFSEVFGMPEIFTLDENCEPVLRGHPKDDLIVYIVRIGGAYHRKTCQHSLNIPYKLWEAEYCCRPCRVCCPPMYDFSWYWAYITVKDKLRKSGVEMIIEDGIIFLEDVEM